MNGPRSSCLTAALRPRVRPYLAGCQPGPGSLYGAWASSMGMRAKHQPAVAPGAPAARCEVPLAVLQPCTPMTRTFQTAPVTGLIAQVLLIAGLAITVRLDG